MNNDHIPDVTKMINQWTNGTEILNVKPNGDFELGNGVDPLVALGQLAKAFMQQQDRIKRLEEAGNALLWYFCPKNTGDISFLQSEAIKQWNKSKEAKP